jgi:glycosyltransferase A (GT-A) superfamily protein (DUF2064 family)
VLDAARAAPAARRVLVLDGDPGLVDARGLDLLPQRTGTLDVRLAAAFAAVSGAPAFLVGMDTPQLTPRHLADAGDALSGRDACLGLAVDGGWWGWASGAPTPACSSGCRARCPPPVGRSCTASSPQASPSRGSPLLRDVDLADDAVQVARFAPTTRFARMHAELSRPAGSRGAVPEAAAS